MHANSPSRRGRPPGAGSYVTKRGNTYYLHFNIPADVRHAFDGHRHERKTLQTTDEALAIQLARPIVSEIEARIAKARERNGPTAVLSRQIAETVGAAELAAADASWDDEATMRAGDVIREAIGEHGPKLEEALKRRDSTRAMLQAVSRSFVDELYWLMEPYWTLSKDRSWSAEILLTTKNELERSVLLLKKKFTNANTFTLDWAYEVWEGQNPTRPPQTSKELRNHLDEFVAFANVSLIEEIRRKHLTDWRGELQKRTLRDGELLATRTVNQRLINVRTILNLAWREMEVPGFDTERILLADAPKTERIEWNRDEILTVLRGLTPGSGLALLFALGLLYGPRISEFCAVLVEDVYFHPDIAWIELRDERTKTKTGRSIVLVDALRPAIERLAAGKAKGDYLLDVKRPSNPELKVGHEASKAFIRAKNKLKVKRLYHELRHTFKANSRRTGGRVQQVTADQISGHAPANVGAIYGKGQYSDLKNGAEVIFETAFDEEMAQTFKRMVGTGSATV